MKELVLSIGLVFAERLDLVAGFPFQQGICRHGNRAGSGTGQRALCVL